MLGLAVLQMAAMFRLELAAQLAPQTQAAEALCHLLQVQVPLEAQCQSPEALVRTVPVDRFRYSAVAVHKQGVDQFRWAPQRGLQPVA